MANQIAISASQVTQLIKGLAPLLDTLIATYLPELEREHDGKMSLVITNRFAENGDTLAYIQNYLVPNEGGATEIMYQGTLEEGIKAGEAFVEEHKAQFFKGTAKSMFDMATTLAKGVFGSAIVGQFSIEKFLTFAPHVARYIDLLREKCGVDYVSITLSVKYHDDEHKVLVNVHGFFPEANAWQELYIDGERGCYWLPTLIARITNLLESQEYAQKTTTVTL